MKNLLSVLSDSRVLVILGVAAVYGCMVLVDKYGPKTPRDPEDWYL